MVKVIIVEDNLLIADLVEDTLVLAGYEVCGTASTVAEAVELCNQHQPDLAVIDIGLANKERGTNIVAQINNRDKIGILYATGNIECSGLSASDGVAYIVKPYQANDLLRALRLVLEILKTGKTSEPLPRNFVILRPSKNKHKPDALIP